METTNILNSLPAQQIPAGSKSEFRSSRQGFSGTKLSNAFDSMNRRGLPQKTTDGSASLVILPVRSKPLLQSYDFKGQATAMGQQNQGTYSTIMYDNDPYGN